MSKKIKAIQRAKKIKIILCTVSPRYTRENKIQEIIQTAKGMCFEE